MILAFLPVILTYILVQVRVSLAVIPVIQDMINSGPPDLTHLKDVLMQVAKLSIPLALLSKFVLLLNLPFALGALMYAYESLFGARTPPAA